MASRSIEALRVAMTAVLAEPSADLPDTIVIENTAAMLTLRRQLDGAISTNLQVMDTRQATTVESAKSTRAWLIEEQHLSPRQAETKLRVARAGVARPAVIEAMRDGDISHKHAELITNFLPKLDGEARATAEQELVKAASELDPGTLNRGLRELTDRLCLDETAEERAVRQHEGRWLRMVETFNGMTRFEAMLGPVEAAIVRTALASLSVKAGELDDRHIGHRRADALVELSKMAMGSGQLPETAGEPTQVAVITDLDELTRKLQAGDTCQSTVNGTPITPNTARMLACDAGITPIVMNGKSEVLDLGRTTRTWTRAQRKAAKIRAGGGCEAPGCQTPIDRCELHHQHHWAHAGKTDLANAIYLCTYHHWVTHHTTWTFTRYHDGQVEIRRT